MYTVVLLSYEEACRYFAVGEKFLIKNDRIYVYASNLNSVYDIIKDFTNKYYAIEKVRCSEDFKKTVNNYKDIYRVLEAQLIHN